MNSKYLINKKRYRIITSVFFLYIKERNILMLRRFNTGYEDGNYSLPAGHVEEDETLSEALSRELFEEIGVNIKPHNFKLVHVMHRKNENRIDFFFTANVKTLYPLNKEPTKADDISWFSLTHLPLNTIPCIFAAINSYRKGHFYSEFS